MSKVSMADSKGVPALFRQRRWWFLLLAGWGIGVALLLGAHLEDIREQSIRIATEGARNMFRMVVLARSWNASHGGVYVPVTPTTQPNPYLKVPKRDVTTTDGVALTLINPAYMTRLISETVQSSNGAVFRLTSLRPVRPGNAADPWEKVALQSFEQGVKEVVSIEPAEGGDMLRYMAPLRVEKPCMACHAGQGYQVGDIRGGISVSQRYAPIVAATADSVLQTKRSYAAVFLLVAALGWILLELLRKRWMELARNVQALGRAHEELIQSEKMASLGRMVAGFAHEINTPVGVAVGAVSHNDETLTRIEGMLSQEEVSEDMLRAELADMRQSGALAMANLRRAAGLVQSFKRTSVDQTSQQLREFPMKELINDVLFAVHSHLKKFPVEVRVDCADDLRLVGMPGLLEQLLTNLVMNAIQHGFDEGQRAGKIDIRAQREGAEVLLQFTDDGKGMDADNLSRIFEPFYTTHRARGGSGLGLYICYNIVTTQLGGSIQCASEPQAGCRFDIRFPVRMKATQEKVIP